MLDIPGFGKLEATILDVSNPIVLVRASDIGMKGTELPEEVNSNKEVSDLLEKIRGTACCMMGFATDLKDATDRQPGVPKVGFVRTPVSFTDIEKKEASPEKLVIGSAYTFSKYRLPEILDDFLEQRPSFRCQVINRQSNVLHQMVLSGELDLAFVRSDYRDGVNRILVERTQGYIVTKGAADLAELPKMNRINYQSNAKTEDLIREWWEDRYGDLRPKEGMAVGYVDFALREVVRGKGYAICFLPPVTELDSKLVKTPLFMKDGNPVSRNPWLIWRMEKKISPAMESFLRYIRKTCQINQ